MDYLNLELLFHPQHQGKVFVFQCYGHVVVNVTAGAE